MHYVVCVLVKIIVLVAIGSAHAAPVFQPTGSSLTYGAISQHQTILSATNNPAGAATMLEVDEGWFGMGIVSSIGIGAEVGPLDDLVDRFDALSQRLNETEISLDTADEIVNEFDDFLIDAGRVGYLSLQAAIQGPLFPLIFTSWETLKGSLAFDTNLSIKTQLNILDSPLQYNILSETIETNSAAYLKTGAVAEASVAYSRLSIQSRKGSLYAGVKVNYFMVGLRKTLIGVAAIDDAQKLLEDEFKEAPKTQGNIGLDFGLMWVAPYYRLGVAFKNLNAPNFAYETIGTNCAKQASNAQDSCFIAKSYANEIDLEETYVMDRQMSLEAALYSESRNFFIATAIDASPVNDPVANPYQWMTLSTGYATSSWWIPGIRLGYRENLVGTEMSYATAGMTLFKMLNVDAAYGLQTVLINGTKYPRAMMINIGLELLF